MIQSGDLRPSSTTRPPGSRRRPAGSRDDSENCGEQVAVGTGRKREKSEVHDGDDQERDPEDDAVCAEGRGPVAEQERVIGRTKLDSVELEDKAPESHVASIDQDTFGRIFRRNMPYEPLPITGRCSSASRPRSGRSWQCWRAMAGLVSGERDALTYYARPLTGAYYFVPSIESLLRVSGGAPGG